MYAIFLLSVLALASAAPRYAHQYARQQSELEDSDPFYVYFKNEDYFEADKFWQKLTEDLLKLDEALSGFHRRFPSGYTQEKVEGDQYKITISLNGFSVGEIIVKAREGLLMVQATHKYENSNMNTYMNLRTLPSNINVDGTWTYEDGVLEIVFPLKSKTETSTEISTVAPKEQSREEMENTTEDFKSDADVGLSRGDKDAEILTNEIPNNGGIEATTYAVDITNDVEFVTVPYK